MMQLPTCLAVAYLLASCTHHESVEPASEAAALELEAPASVPAPEQRYFMVRDEAYALAGKHPWAGIYSSSGTDTSDELLVAPRNGWVLKGHSNGGDTFRGAGEVREEDGWLRFEQDGSVANPR